MSSGPIVLETSFTFRTKRRSTFSALESGDVSTSARTLATSSLLPSNSAATAACDFVQNGHWFRCDVYAAINSRKPGESGAASRIISCVKRSR